ncbi:MAG: 2,3-diketo-5-methylthio-phosphopentane phosphatase [Thermoleophilia bacterium]|nr:2,3-diketo-5-methylthio-phosphopentane phosphatase [Thermoleophilia bacterium]
MGGYHPRMLIVADFDGTITEVEPLTYLAARFAPKLYASWEDQLHSGEASLRDVFVSGFSEVTVSAAELVGTAVREVPIRAGFRELIDHARGHGDRLVVLSAGFRQIIEPMLAHGGVGDVELIANEMVVDAGGMRASFRELPTCPVCGEPCKRGDIERLRAEGTPGEHVVLIGDGYSDRCAAEIVDTVFARDPLCGYLDESGVPYVRYDDFAPVVVHLRAIG